MSVRIGDRATYGGKSVIVVEKAPALVGPRWLVYWKNGKAASGWSYSYAEESDLEGVTRKTWDVDDEVKVGYSPVRLSGTISAIETDEAGDRIFSVLIAADTHRETPEGTRWTRDAHTMRVKANALDTHT